MLDGTESFGKAARKGIAPRQRSAHLRSGWSERPQSLRLTKLFLLGYARHRTRPKTTVFEQSDIYPKQDVQKPVYFIMNTRHYERPI